MYKKGDLVVYENSGVCKISDIIEPDFMKPEKRKLCYVLNPVFKSGTIYTPVDSEKAFIRPVISKKEALEYIDSISDMEIESYTVRKSTELEDIYKDAMRTHNCGDLIKLELSIHARRKEALANNKKISQIDDRYYNTVCELIEGELSIALDIPKEDVSDFITDRVTEKAK